MADRNTPMSPNAFLQCRVQYGSDIMVWPDGLREQALVFTATHEGKQLEETERALDSVFAEAAVFSNAQGPAAERFLSNLEAIPDQYPRLLVNVPAPSVFVRFVGAVSRFFESGQLWTPMGVTAQAVVCAALLSVGVFVGAQQPMDGDLEDYDVSAGLFAANEQGFSLDVE